MLTLKEPLKLNIDDGLTTVSEDMFERISGNYGIMSAHITPKELLFYMSAPPELPDDLGGMTTIGIQTNISDNRAITMDVINNVINRILISNTDNFTYQDEVYIESVLHKLGISNVSLFMKQVQKLTDEHVSVRQLISLYNQELKLRAGSTAPSEAAALTHDSDSGAYGEPSDAASQYFLHDHIYKRLETKDIYNIVNSFQQEQTHYYGTYHKNQIKTAEQLYISNLLRLSELRQQALGDKTLIMKHSVNHFELGDLTDAPKTEDEVLAQAAAAALISTVEHILVHQLQKSGQPASGWISLESVLSETIENSIARFQSYHSGDAIFMNRDADLNLEISNLHHDEIEILQELISIRSQLSAIGSSTHGTPSLSELPPLLLQQLIQGDFTEQSLSSELLNTVIQNLASQSYTEQNEQLISHISEDLTQNILRPSSAPLGGEPDAIRPLSLEHPENEADEIPLGLDSIPTQTAETTLTSSEITRLTQQFLSEEPSSEALTPPRFGEPPATIIESSKTVSELELEHDLRTSSELLREIVQDDGQPETPVEDAPSLKHEAAAESAEQLQKIRDAAPSFESPAASSLQELNLQNLTHIAGDILFGGESDIIPPLSLEHPETQADEIPLGFDSVPPQAAEIKLTPSEITRLTQQFMSENIAEELKSGSIPAQILRAAFESPKTVKEIELEYDVRAGTELLRDIIYSQEQSYIASGDEPSHTPSAPAPISETLRTMWEKTISSSRQSTSSYREQTIENFNQSVGEILAAELPDLSYAQPMDEQFSPTEKSHPLTDAEAPPELIAQELAEINQRNRELFQSVQGLRAGKIAESIPVPDAPKTMSDALRALEHPEAVLRELMSAPVQTEHPQPQLNPAASAYMDSADPISRKVVEAVLRYESDPQSVISEGIFHPANLGEFNSVATVHAPAPRDSHLETERLARETVKLNEKTDTLLEHYREAPAIRQTVFQEPSRPPRVPIIHKQEQSTFSEELLERLEQQRAAQTVTTTVSENVDRQEVHEVSQNMINSQVITQTTEDITQLINKTLAKQMNTISDKVYQQMERRLQTERSRRGRF